MKSTLCSRALKTTALTTVCALAAILPNASAAPFYWGQTTVVSGTYSGNAATAANWYTDAAGSNVSGTAPNSLSDDLFFNTTPANAVGGAVTIGANLSANSLSFTTSGATILAQDANRNLVLGSGGITLGASSGNVNVGINTNALSVRLAASQTWTNQSSSVLNVRNITTNAGSGAVSLTLNAAGSGNIVLPLSISDSVDNPLSLVVSSVGSGTVTLAASSYRGGTTINGGRVSATGSLGAGGVLLGATSGAAEAFLTVNSNAFANALTVRAGSTGTKTLVTTNAAGVLNGDLILNDSLSLNSTGALTTLNGDISGSGDLVKGGAGSVVLTGENTLAGDLTIDAGALTLANGGSFTFTIGANGVNNQINGASAGLVSLNGTVNFNLTGAALVDGNSWSIVTVSNAFYGGTFAITGFTESNNVWTNGLGFTFTESSGLLTYAVPEPSTGLLLLGGVVGLFAIGRRRRPACRG